VLSDARGLAFAHCFESEDLSSRTDKQGLKPCQRMSRRHIEPRCWCSKALVEGDRFHHLPECPVPLSRQFSHEHHRGGDSQSLLRTNRIWRILSATQSAVAMFPISCLLGAHLAHSNRWQVRRARWLWTEPPNKADQEQHEALRPMLLRWRKGTYVRMRWSFRNQQDLESEPAEPSTLRDRKPTLKWARG
jgi:hypothetical protein